MRKAKTVFGCANLILNELGLPSLKSAQGVNLAIEQITKGIEAIFQPEKRNDISNKRLFALALDEFDVIFYDKRTSPSDFIYKLLEMGEILRQNHEGLSTNIIAISNNVMSDREIDDRVRSRIGSDAVVFFPPYAFDEIEEILKERASNAFTETIDPEILRSCAMQSGRENGDARRAIDLLRVAAETAGAKGKKLAIEDVYAADLRLQEDRINTVVSYSSFHLKLVSFSLARLTYLLEKSWNSTSDIYEEYCAVIDFRGKPLSYRRISELLTELENTGLVESKTLSKGRHGYGREYRLTVPPEPIGKAASPSRWEDLVRIKKGSMKELGPKSGNEAADKVCSETKMQTFRY